IAMLATSSNKKYTADVISHFMESHMPLALARICDVRLDSLLFNPAAETVLQGLTVATQFDSNGNST
ncbi:hypothetical protein BDB00DRAFT_731972, partial [Zychaea mexicana]|uniref:uncharacterized protein n=1 Tax=Zychaea mexicana TaxID=64656 RepID=UPI0022FEFC27